MIDPEEDEAATMFNAMALRIDGLEARWRRFENDDAISNLMQGGIEWLGPSSISVDELAALAVETGDLTVTGVLTLGPGGSIMDADGSTWDQDGLVLQAGTDPGTPGDVIQFIRDGEDPIAEILSGISAATANLTLRAKESSGATGVGYMEINGSTGSPRASAILGIVSPSGVNSLVGVGMGSAAISFYGDFSAGSDMSISAGLVKVDKVFALTDGITAPSTQSGQARIYVDSADGDLKVKFGDGVVKTLAADT